MKMFDHLTRALDTLCEAVKLQHPWQQDALHHQ